GVGGGSSQGRGVDSERTSRLPERRVRPLQRARSRGRSDFAPRRARASRQSEGDRPGAAGDDLQYRIPLRVRQRRGDRRGSPAPARGGWHGGGGSRRRSGGGAPATDRRLGRGNRRTPSCAASGARSSRTVSADLLE